MFDHVRSVSTWPYFLALPRIQTSYCLYRKIPNHTWETVNAAVVSVSTDRIHFTSRTLLSFQGLREKFSSYCSSERMYGRKCPGREKTAASWLMGNSRRSDSFWKLNTPHRSHCSFVRLEDIDSRLLRETLRFIYCLGLLLTPFVLFLYDVPLKFLFIYILDNFFASSIRFPMLFACLFG